MGQTKLVFWFNKKEDETKHTEGSFSWFWGHKLDCHQLKRERENLNQDGGKRHQGQVEKQKWVYFSGGVKVDNRDREFLCKIKKRGRLCVRQ